MKAVQDFVAFLFILAVSILSAISVLGVWKFLENDVIYKSFQTLGLLAVVALVVIAAGRFVETRAGGTLPVMTNPAFPALRKTTLSVLILCAALLALVGVLAIWDVIADKDMLYKVLGSLAIIVFGAFIIVMTCLERENKNVTGQQGGGSSLGVVFFFLIVGYFVLALFRASLFG